MMNRETNRTCHFSWLRCCCAILSLILLILTFLDGSSAFHLSKKPFYVDPQLRSENCAKGSEVYTLSAIENRITTEQSSQRPKLDKYSRLNKERGTIRKKGRRNPKTLGGAQILMPPWLSRYENEDLTTPFYISDTFQSTSVKKPSYERESHVQRLHLALNGVFRQTLSSETSTSSSTDMMIPEVIPHFTKLEIHEIMDSIRVASRENTQLMAGCADFLYLMLTLEEEGALDRSGAVWNNEPWDDDDISSNGRLDWENGSELISGGPTEPFSIMTRDVLVAAAFHYCDCVRARKAGVYDYTRQAMEASFGLEVGKRGQLSLPHHLDQLEEVGGMDPERRDEYDVVTKGSQSIITVAECEAMVVGAECVGNSQVGYYGDESVKIVAGAARLKRAEIMATTINSSGSLISKGPVGKSNVDAEILRSFLVSLSKDWRSLVIRSAACLYRLKGITDDVDTEGAVDNGTCSALTRSTNIIARDAFKVYAPLAQRLGMQRLKSELENRAFRILYPRQYSVASSLYSTGMDEMKSIVHVLSSRIEQLLKSDQVFNDQVKDVSVSSRVKEPYSLWRKMIRYRKEATGAKKNVDRQFEPSLKWIPDMIALRVVLRARRLSSLEGEESLSTRDKMMCYYALQIISDVWPASPRNEAKDYIKNPKPNGYQSLHYTASLSISGEECPFEVQIRSEEMNRVAEFGVAAHWDYKLQNKVVGSLPEASHPSGISPELPLLLELKPERQVIITESSSTTQKSRIASYIDALTASREKIVKNNLFVFLSSTERALDGSIVSIDPSATQVAEVLKMFGANIDENMLDEISNGALTLYRNGVRTSLDEELYNGDVLTLPHILLDKKKLSRMHIVKK